MATPIDQISFNELAPTLKALAKAGGTTDHADWIRAPGNSERLIRFIDEQRGCPTPKRGMVPVLFGRVFRIHVNYDLPCNAESLKKRFPPGRLGRAFSSDQTWHLHPSCTEISQTSGDRDMLIQQFHGTVDLGSVIDKMRLRGFRPAIHLELIAFILSFASMWAPELSGLAAIGSSVVADDGRVRYAQMGICTQGYTLLCEEIPSGEASPPHTLLFVRKDRI